MSLLAHDLEVRSSGSCGRSLIQRLEDYRIDLLGATRADEFARLLQSREPDAHQALEEFLEWTGVDDDFLLIGLVALVPDLDRLASRLSGGYPGDDVISELLAHATVALRWTHELIEGERTRIVLVHAFSKTRGEKRRMARHNVPTCPLFAGDDLARPEVPSHHQSQGMLVTAVEQFVITVEDARLIESTRVKGHSLDELADTAGTSYDALRMRRARAETRLRRYFTSTGEIR
jgi:DNA-directed RNA polymerase specialized sigma24 family protein